MQGFWITKETLPVLDDLIPEKYQRQLLAEEAEGLVFLDDWWDNKLIGVVILREQNGWVELAWLCLDRLYRGSDYAVQILEYCKKMLGTGRAFSGMFAEFSEESDYLREIFEDVGFSFKQITYECYETTLSALQSQPLFQPDRLAHTAQGNICLGAMDKGMTQRLQSSLKKISELPLPAMPELSKYDNDVSFVHYDQKQQLDAIIFIAAYAEHLAIECAWTVNPAAFLSALQSAQKAAAEKYPPDMRVTIPTITETSAKLAKKLIGSKETYQILQASIQF